MGFLDFFKGGSRKCACCKKESDSLPYAKKLDGAVKQFCSKECSRKYRIDRKKEAKNPPKTGGGLPW
ncbi:MAG: hypothetical protein V1703_00435 [Candidatus Altiarchaeota archaeon]